MIYIILAVLSLFIYFRSRQWKYTYFTTSTKSVKSIPPEDDLKISRELRQNHKLTGPIKWQKLPTKIQKDFQMQTNVDTGLYIEGLPVNWLSELISQIFGNLQQPSIDNDYTMSAECIWSRELIEKYISAIRQKKEIGPKGYFCAGKDLLLAMQKINTPPETKSMVIGSMWPWAEAILLSQNNITRVTTTDYVLPKHTPDVKDLIIFHDAQNIPQTEYGTYDLIVSYSSIEHDGLGRYSDPINPNGYLAALHEMRLLLKPNGYLLLAVPLGPFDYTVYNAHRIFGPNFIEMLKTKFCLLAFVWNGVCYESELSAYCLTSKYISWVSPHSYQPVLILQKGDY